MKKVLSLLLAVLLLLMTVSCSSRPENIWYRAYIQIQTVEAISYTLTEECALGEDDELVVWDSKDVYVRGLDSEEPEGLYVLNSLNPIFGGYRADIYSGKDYYYFKDSIGTYYESSYKIKKDNVDGSYDHFWELYYYIRELPAEVFDGATVEKTENMTVLTVPVDTYTFAELFGDVLEGAGDTEYKYEYIEPGLELTFAEDNRLSKFVLSYDAKMERAFNVTYRKYRITIEIHAYNDDVVLTPPEGYEDFEEISSMPEVE